MCAASAGSAGKEPTPFVAVRNRMQRPSRRDYTYTISTMYSVAYPAQRERERERGSGWGERGVIGGPFLLESSNPLACERARH